jgi:hypothetical protein
MPRVLILYLTIVAAFPASLAAAPPISDDVVVSAEVAAVARTLGLDPPRDRARFASEFARLVYTPAMGKSQAVAALLNPKLVDPALVAVEKPFRVPVPLSADVWSRILKRTIRPDQLFAAIMSDRRAALVCYALSALDDETLEYLAQHPDILMRVSERDAPQFAAFGASLRIHGSHVAPPGGASAVAVWETVLRESTANAEAFVRALFSANQGHVAYLYDTIAQLPGPIAAFALGTSVTDPGIRGARFNALVDVSTRSYREWRIDALPFSKPLHDLSVLFLRMRVEPGGVPVAPASRAFWSSVFGSDDLRADSALVGHDAASDAPIDAAWLAETTSGSDMFWRGDRLDQFAFGQRLFAGAPPNEWPDAIVAIRAFPKQRMLLLTLERMGIRTPSVYATIARQAARVTGGNPNRAFWTLAQLQSSVALLARMTFVGTLTQPEGQRLVTSLFNLPAAGDRYEGAVAAWLERELLPFMPAGDDVESRLIAGMAGPDPGTKAPKVFWEGQSYRLDLAAGERHRLRSIRDKQEGYSVDLALALAEIAKALAGPNLTAEKIRTVAQEFARFPERFDKRLTSPEARAPGVDEPRQAREWIEKAIEDLSKAGKSGDVKRAARLSSTIIEHVDDILGDALLSLAYAGDLGDPGGAAMLARNVAIRHDFGFGRKDGEVRVRTVWSVPRQDFLPGVPWHVTGAVVGLDIALATLSLKRVSPDQVGDAPRLPSNEREAFAIGVALMNPRQLKDDDRDAIARAVERGRQRVAALAAGIEPVDEVANGVAMDGWRRRAIRWMIGNDPVSIPSMFTLVEFLKLGGGAEGANLDAWGTTALQSLGCACTRMSLPSVWHLLSGRPQMAFMASGMGDLNLFIAMKLSELRLPAALARTILQAAMLDFIEGVTPTDPNDWWTIVRAARTVPQDVIEDYIAAAAAVDGPLVPDETESTREP